MPLITCTCGLRIHCQEKHNSLLSGIMSNTKISIFELAGSFLSIEKANMSKLISKMRSPQRNASVEIIALPSSVKLSPKHNFCPEIDIQPTRSSVQTLVSSRLLDCRHVNVHLCLFHMSTQCTESPTCTILRDF